MKRPALAALMAVLALTSCAAPASTTAPAVATASPSGSSGTAQSPDEDYPNAPAVTWDAAGEQGAKDAAVKAMTLFARPGVDQKAWIRDLGPLLGPEYLAEADYIAPSRVPVSKVLGGPTLSRQSGDPMTVTAEFQTDAGAYAVLLHRPGQGQPWLVESIRPEAP